MAEERAPENVRDYGRRRWRRVVVVIVVVALPVAVFLGRVWWIERQIDAELARIRAAGEPVTVNDINRFDATHPTDDEATSLWLTALDSLGEAEFEEATKGIPPFDYEKKLVLPGEPWPERQACEAFLTEHAVTLELLNEAAQSSGRVQFPGKWSRFQGSPVFQYISNCRIASRLLQLDAYVAAHRGDPKRAAEAILAMFALSRLCLDEEAGTDTVTLTLGLAFESLASGVVEQLVPRVSFEESQLSRFQGALAPRQEDRNLYRAVLTKRVEGIVLFQNWYASWQDFQVSKQVGGRSDTTEATWTVWWSCWRRRDFLEFLNRMRVLAEAGKQPLPEAIRQARVVYREVEALRSEGRLANVRFFLTPRLVKYGLSAFSATATWTARRRAAYAGIAVERFRIRNGKLPQSLQELVPEFLPKVPDDPYNGGPLRYVIEEKGYVVYSVGRDGKDDGGKGRSTRGPDLVFRVSRSSAD